MAMRLFDSLLNRLTPRNRRTSPNRRQRRPSLELLEARRPLSATILLHFDGATQQQIDNIVGQIPTWPDHPTSGGLIGFVEGFPTLNQIQTWQSVSGAQFTAGYNEFSFLDFDSDGQIDQQDGEIAVDRIMERVAEDFSPYDVQILRVGSPSGPATLEDAVNLMQASNTQDTLVFVNGGDVAVGGQAPSIDIGNQSNDVCAAGDSVGVARWLFESGITRPADSFLNITANFISHEIGHSFGLAHIDVTVSPEANDRSLMDPFLFTRNMRFADVAYWTESGFGWQNEHQRLIEVLGPATESWAAVLRPGELTIQGSEQADSFTVESTAAGHWMVYASSSNSSYFVDPSVLPGMNSLNQFVGGIDRIVFEGGDGNDLLYVDDTIQASVRASGGSGHDTLFGGGGRDYLYGGAGNDQLFGGSRSDQLYGEAGSDLLIGGTGGDQLYGGTGSDWLYGNAGNDYLDGGFDYVSDHLFGGTGADTFVEHQCYLWLDELLHLHSQGGA